VCGFNFSFGRKAEGNCETLKKYFEENGLQVTVMPPLSIGGDIVSSSLIRAKIESGNIEDAEKLLGHPFSIFLPVTQGQQLGRKIGIPTINQLFPENSAVPRFGVYACRCHIDGETHLGIANVGVRPTIIEKKKVIGCETHILDYSGDLYGKKIRVDFCKFIREEKKFASLDELVTEINKNIAQIREYFSE
jgi:riboflavin kinase/FMN adenylyltransferase